MNYVENNISFTGMINYVDVVVQSSFGATGRYHKYLRDYAETFVLASLFTDHSFEGLTEVQIIEESLTIFNSAEWKNEILPKITIYEAFHDYVESEIEYRTRPLANMDDLLGRVNELVGKVTELLSSIDKEKLSNFDFTGLADMLNLASSIQEKNNDNKDNQGANGNITDIASLRDKKTEE